MRPSLVLGLFALACGRTALDLPLTDTDPASTCPAGAVAEVTVSSWNHVSYGTVVQYNSNPPAGGDHYPVWAVWGVHSDVVPDVYFVHNEEHGGVILLYNCPQGCPEIVSELTDIVNAQPADPLCEGTGVNARMLLTPDPDLDVPVAAATWGWTYKEASACVDAASLNAFISAHYGQGREPLCGQGLFQ